MSWEPLEFPSYGSLSVRACALQDKVDKRLEKGTLELVDQTGLGFYSRLFLVQKEMGGGGSGVLWSTYRVWTDMSPSRSCKWKQLHRSWGRSEKGTWCSRLTSKTLIFSFPFIRILGLISGSCLIGKSTSSGRSASAFLQLPRSSPGCSPWPQRGPMIEGFTSFTTSMIVWL